jgi:hypothetical protein
MDRDKQNYRINEGQTLAAWSETALGDAYVVLSGVLMSIDSSTQFFKATYKQPMSS